MTPGSARPLRSRLLTCEVMHHRLLPREHRFRYRLPLLVFDLDELPRLDRELRLFSHGRANLYSFHDEDYFPTPEPIYPGPLPPRASAGPLQQRVLAYLSAHGVDLPGGRIELVTLPRVLGYAFNPVSFYFAFDASDRPVAAIAEVTNTFREMKLYFLGPATFGQSQPGRFSLRVPKQFYVSPFSDVDVQFDFHLGPPAPNLGVRIDDYAGAQRTLTSTLGGTPRPLTDGALLGSFLRHPLIPLRVITLIHWHALRLWLKRLPWYAKAARPAEQRGLYRPHASLPSVPPA